MLIRLRLLTYNQRLVEARKEQGWTQVELAQLAGIFVQHLSEIELLKRFPTLDEAQEIADAVDKPREWLFPPELVRFRQIPRIAFLTAEQAKRISWIPERLLPSPEDRKIDLPDKIKEVMGSLNPQENKIITLRFGLDGNDSRTLEDVGKELGVNRERIRQIEAKALRKLRHPSRKLKDYLD